MPTQCTPRVKNHILNGDETGGGHLYPGRPGKSSFPKDWTEEMIISAVESVANDKRCRKTRLRSNGIPGSATHRWKIAGRRNQVEIRVVVENSGSGDTIVTAFPEYLPGDSK